MIEKLKEYYNKDYERKSVYVILTALITFILGMLVYYLAGRTGPALSFIGAVLKPLILGMCIAYLLSPIVSKFQNGLFSGLQKEKTKRVLAVLLTFIIVVMALALIIAIITVTVTKSLSSIRMVDLKEFAAMVTSQFQEFRETIEKTLESLNINLGSFGNLVSKIFSGVKSGASTLLFAVIFSIYFLLDAEIRAYWKDVLFTFTSEKTRSKLHELAADADKVFSGYIRGQALDAMLVGVLVSVALLIAGIPYAVVIGILTGIGNLIPYVGPVVGFGSLIVVSLANASIHDLIVGGIILIVVMFIDGNIINPRMLSSNVEVHPVLVIVALLAGGRVGGIVGMLISVPVAAFLKLQFEKYLAMRKARAVANADGTALPEEAKAIGEAEISGEAEAAKEKGSTDHKAVKDNIEVGS